MFPGISDFIRFCHMCTMDHLKFVFLFNVQFKKFDYLCTRLDVYNNELDKYPEPHLRVTDVERYDDQNCAEVIYLSI